MMETLSLRSQPMSPHASLSGSLRSASRLSSPESGMSRYDSQRYSGQDYERSFPAKAPTMNDAVTYETTRRRRDSRVNGFPISPPYQSSDAQRPILPPIKTILGDAMSSPPPTPNLKSVPVQPSPCEPTFSSQTFKPLAFYPNKKARTDFRLEPVAPVTNAANWKGSGSPPTSYDGPRGWNSMDDRAQSSKSNYSRAQHHSSRQRDGNMVSHPAANGVRRPSSYRPGHAGHGSRPTVHPDYEYEPYHRPREDSIPHSSCDERDFDGREMGQPYSYYVEHHGDGSLQPGYVDRPSIPQSERHQIYAPAGMLHAAHQVPPRPYFVPNHYEYQQSKTRKRSNLPKQSTEIMRTWFEQNITNPYPSEEQKAIFSNATGISMTQVSNWFINHRRRCPELRDKRDKVRGKDTDA